MLCHFLGLIVIWDLGGNDGALPSSYYDLIYVIQLSLAKPLQACGLYQSRAN